MRYRKVYGQSKVTKCMFCSKQATTTNEQEIPVCIEHKNSELNAFKCACGEYLDLMNGKYGPFFKCERCGIINMRKALEMNEIKDISKPVEKVEKKESSVSEEDPENAEEIVMPGDPRYFD